MAFERDKPSNSNKSQTVREKVLLSSKSEKLWIFDRLNMKPCEEIYFGMNIFEDQIINRMKSLGVDSTNDKILDSYFEYSIFCTRW